MAEWTNERDYFNDLSTSVHEVVKDAVQENDDVDTIREVIYEGLRDLADNYCIYYWTTRQIIFYSAHVDAFDYEDGSDTNDRSALQLIGLIAYHAILADLEEQLDMNDQYNNLEG